MRSFLVSLPPETKPSNVLLFLHGVGEAFIPLRDEDKKKLYSAEPGDALKSPGVRNLLNHGVPMMLGRPGEHTAHNAGAASSVAPFSLPLFRDFVVIAPQMFLREDMASPRRVDSMMNDACELAKSLVGSDPRIALFGFSRGGFAAFQVAARPEVKVVVTMDAAPPENDVPAFRQAIANQQKPMWMFCADYAGCDADFEARITKLHREAAIPEVENMNRVPREDRCKTTLKPAGTKIDRHNYICDAVSSSAMVYEWMIEHL